MATAGLRIGVVGATGALGSQVLAALDESPLRIRELLPIGTDRSVGEEIELGGELYPVEHGEPSLRGLDLLFLCAPAAAALEFARAALRAQVPCIDLAGALAGADEVPLAAAGLHGVAEARTQPVVSSPGGASLAWARVLHPIHRAVPLRRVTGTLIDAASAGGRGGIEALYAESLAIFNQQELPEPEVFGAPVAFDCLPDPSDPGSPSGESPREARLAADLARLFGGELAVGVTAVQVPAFVGHASVLTLEASAPLEPAQAEELLAKAPGVELWSQGPASGPGPNLRAASGRDVVIVGRPRPDPSEPGALRLWLVADVLCLSAANAVALAVARLHTH